MKIQYKLLAATAFAVLISNNALAEDRSNHRGEHDNDGWRAWSESTRHHHSGPEAQGTGAMASGGQSHKGGVSVPEIDGAMGTSAIALLVGIMALMKEKSRSRKAACG